MSRGLVSCRSSSGLTACPSPNPNSNPNPELRIPRSAVQKWEVVGAAVEHLRRTLQRAPAEEQQALLPSRHGGPDTSLLPATETLLDLLGKLPPAEAPRQGGGTGGDGFPSSPGTSSSEQMVEYHVKPPLSIVHVSSAATETRSCCRA